MYCCLFSHLEVLDYLNKNEFDIKGGAYAKYVTPAIYEALKSVKPKYADIPFFNIIIRDLQLWMISQNTFSPTKKERNCTTSWSAFLLFALVVAFLVCHNAIKAFTPSRSYSLVLFSYDTS